MANIPHITAENAAEIAKAGWLVRKARAEQAQAEKLDPVMEADIAERHRKARLLRVRKQQERVDEMLLAEDDPAKLDRLASAAIRLNEQERQLSNRSLPPTLKASQVKTKRSTGGAIEPESA